MERQSLVEDISSPKAQDIFTRICSPLSRGDNIILSKSPTSLLKETNPITRNSPRYSRSSRSFNNKCKKRTDAQTSNHHSLQDPAAISFAVSGERFSNKQNQEKGRSEVQQNIKQQPCPEVNNQDAEEKRRIALTKELKAVLLLPKIESHPSSKSDSQKSTMATVQNKTAWVKSPLNLQTLIKETKIQRPDKSLTMTPVNLDSLFAAAQQIQNSKPREHMQYYGTPPSSPGGYRATYVQDIESPLKSHHVKSPERNFPKDSLSCVFVKLRNLDSSLKPTPKKTMSRPPTKKRDNYSRLRFKFANKDKKAKTSRNEKFSGRENGQNTASNSRNRDNGKVYHQKTDSKKSIDGVDVGPRSSKELSREVSSPVPSSLSSTPYRSGRVCCFLPPFVVVCLTSGETAMLQSSEPLPELSLDMEVACVIRESNFDHFKWLIEFMVVDEEKIYSVYSTKSA